MAVKEKKINAKGEASPEPELVFGGGEVDAGEDEDVLEELVEAAPVS
jgi:hypothetical protein